jgi:predicted dehydrogenase
VVKKLDRRQFLGRSAAAAVVLGSPRPLSSAQSGSALDRLNIASIGVHNRAAGNLKGVASENIVALVDIDQEFLDAAGETWPNARRYRDYRVMLEKEAEKIDAVLVSTPDHTHAPAVSMALQMKKHVYCEKPLTHTIYEARKLAELAAENGLVTQMGTQVHAEENYRLVVELVRSGAIGEIREVHVWVNVDYSGRRMITGRPRPGHVDWDLWLGPAMARPYCESFKEDGSVVGVHPFNWRWFWDYGTGSLGDFGCHWIDLPHWALDLKHPTRVWADGPAPLLESTSSGVVVTYEYPARGSLPPVTLKWYDGGKRPDLLAGFKDPEGQPLDPDRGQLFVGSEGMILSNYSEHMLLPVEKFAGFKRPDPFIPRSPGHHQEWIQAIKTGGTANCNFDYSGALTEAVLLGVVAYRSGRTIEWDARSLRITNSAAAQQLLHKEYRKGWTL